MSGRITIEGQTFYSTAELEMYFGLKAIAKEGRISDLEVHPEIPLVVNNRLVATYQPTFRFMDHYKGYQRTVQVVAKTASPVRELKIKLFEALYETYVEAWR